MKLDSGMVEYLLTQEFGSVVSGNLSRSIGCDYPILFDDTADMNGHVALVPQHERPVAQTGSEHALYVCLGEESARSARESNLAFIYVTGGISFRRLYNFMQDVFVRNERLDARLQAYVSTYAGFQPLLKACALAMNCSFSLIDSRYRPIAQVSCRPDDESENAAPDDFEVLESEIIDLFMASQRYRHMRASRRVFAVPGSSDLLMKNIFSGGKLVGVLSSRHDGTPSNAKYVQFLLGYLGAYVEAMYALMGSFGIPSTAPARIKAALANVRTGDAADRTLLESNLVEAGHRAGNPYVVLKIERSFTNEGAEARDYLAHRFELVWPHAYCFSSSNNLFMLVDIGEGPVSAGTRFLHDLLPMARDNLTKIGISRAFTDFNLMPQAIDQAEIALEQGKVANPENWCYRFEEYALAWIVSSLRQDSKFDAARHPAVAVLRAYDSNHGTTLTDTLKTFMQYRYNATEASKALFVARSTLLNRLERVTELTGIDLEDPDERLYLTLSLVVD